MLEGDGREFDQIALKREDVAAKGSFALSSESHPADSDIRCRQIPTNPTIPTK
jgi:hypothetical protein